MEGGRLSKRDVRRWMLEDLERAKKGYTRRDVMEHFGISYHRAAGALEALVDEGLAAKARKTVRGPIFRYIYYPLLFRTQYAEIYYSEEPVRESKGLTTPDPIGEFRVTVVMAEKGLAHKLIENGPKILVHLGMILAPWNNWRSLMGAKYTPFQKYVAFEEDEPITPDELELSIPDYRELGYAERYAIFFRGRRERWIREEIPDIYQRPLDEFLKIIREEETGVTARPNPYGHFEYSEKLIKELEELRIRGELYPRFILRARFNNRTWELEPA